MKSMDVDIFGSKDNAQKTFDMVEGFLVSYIKNKSTMPIQEWLVKEMSNSGVWGDELESIADIIIEQAALRAEIRLAYEEHINSGKSEESFIAGYIRHILSFLENILPVQLKKTRKKK